MKQKNWVIIGLVVVGAIIFLGQPNALSSKLRMIFVQLSTPFAKLGDYTPFVRDRRQLARENAKLRAEANTLRLQNQALGEQGRENLRLHQLLNLKQHLVQTTVAARVIGRDAANWWKTIQIDRGSNDGVRENCPVMTDDGLIGKTISVTRGESRVLLLIDPNCKVSALLQDSRTPGVVAGLDEKFTSQPHCLMTYVERATKTKTGEAVITSGLGGVYPKGILIGTVVGAQLNQQSGMYQDIEIKPTADFLRLEEVLVILP